VDALRSYKDLNHRHAAAVMLSRLSTSAFSSSTCITKTDRRSLYVCLSELFEEAVQFWDTCKVFGALAPGFLLHPYLARYQNDDSSCTCVLLAARRSKSIRRCDHVSKGFHRSCMSISSENVKSHQKNSGTVSDETFWPPART